MGTRSNRYYEEDSSKVWKDHKRHLPPILRSILETQDPSSKEISNPSRNELWGQAVTDDRHRTRRYEAGTQVDEAE